MRVRFRWVLAAGVVAWAGCSDALNEGPIPFAQSEQLGRQLAGKPKLQATIGRILRNLYGPSPRTMNVPKGAPLPAGGAYLANHVIVAGQPGKPVRLSYHDSITDKDRPVEGGYALFRRHCLHCHGVSGDGNGPTSAFLWPRPRDFRKGIFKFTSANVPNKPTRDDLRKTLRDGLPKTAMPSFEALMSPQEMEQVIDYVMFLSMRGETELALINEATVVDEADAATYFTPEVQQGLVNNIFDQWRNAEADVLNPPIARTPSSAESLRRRRALFLGQTREKLECAGCHGAKADGTGPTWIDEKTWNKYVFGSGIEQDRYDEAQEDRRGAAEEMGRRVGPAPAPANLNDGDRTVYKGGRRPIDIYWRIAKGINGTPMPAHASTLKPEQIWDLVNFVLALPYQPELLRDTTTPTTMARR